MTSCTYETANAAPLYDDSIRILADMALNACADPDDNLSLTNAVFETLAGAPDDLQADLVASVDQGNSDGNDDAYPEFRSGSLGDWGDYSLEAVQNVLSDILAAARE
jgi:hypothetical protein